MMSMTVVMISIASSRKGRSGALVFGKCGGRLLSDTAAMPKKSAEEQLDAAAVRRAEGIDAIPADTAMNICVDKTAELA